MTGRVCVAVLAAVTVWVSGGAAFASRPDVEQTGDTATAVVVVAPTLPVCDSARSYPDGSYCDTVGPGHGTDEMECVQVDEVSTVCKWEFARWSW